MSLSIDNIHRPAPKWFRRLKKALMVLVLAANTMIASWGLPDPLLVARLQLWCTIGVQAILEALELLLSGGEEYVTSNDTEISHYKT